MVLNLEDNTFETWGSYICISLLQAFVKSLNQRAQEVDRHLTEAEAFNQRLPHLQIADKAHQLSKRYSILLTSCRVSYDQNMLSSQYCSI